MNRTDTVKDLMSQVSDDDIVIASTGFIAREVFKYDRPLNFYMMGSMGNALAIGLGLAKNVRQRVVVINGDGSVLMSLGTMLTVKRQNPDNLIHIILDNNCHESTGGQRTVSDLINFELLNKNTIVLDVQKDDSIPPRITMSPKEITERFKSAIKNLGN